MPRVLPCAAALAAALLLAPAAPAWAASGITSPGAGEVVTADAVVPLRAVVEGEASEPSELSLLAPGGATAEVVAVSPGAGELAHDLDTSCAAPACTGRVPAPNGTWTLRLSGAAEDERTFVLRIPPAAPIEVTAARSEAGVTVRWQQGEEPDLRGYRVEDAEGKVVRDRIGLDACDAERFCSVEVPEAAAAWKVVAFRATCPDCTDLLASPTSDAARVQGDTAPVQPVGVEPSAVPPSAAPAPAGPVRGPGQGEAFRDAFGSSRPAVAAPAPPRSAGPAAPPDAGEYGTELGYGEREVVVREPRAPLARAQEAVTGTLLTAERLRLLVLSLLMVAGSLWLRRWARRTVAD